MIEQKRRACLMSEIGREAQRRGSGLVVMEWMGYDGPITRLLKQLAVETNHTFIEFDVWERASLCRQVRAEEGYWLRGIGKNRRRTMRQHHLHLEAALGTSPSVRTRTDDAAVATFMRLEASGWKGHQPGGLALGLRATTTRFFEEVCHRYLDSGRMWFLSLEGGGTPIAMLCCVRAGETVFACRTAYDENFAKFGPGVEIFLAAMEHFVPRPTPNASTPAPLVTISTCSHCFPTDGLWLQSCFAFRPDTEPNLSIEESYWRHDPGPVAWPTGTRPFSSYAAPAAPPLVE